MGTFYGIKPHIVTSDDINSIVLSNTTIDNEKTGNLGYMSDYEIFVNHNNEGCSNSYIELVIKNDIIWNFITFELVLTGVASCWNFNGSNMSGYNESLGDVILHPFNSWEYPEFQSHDRTSACDNESNNFFHSSYHKGNPKTFIMRRRKTSTNTATSIYSYRACNGLGSTLIRKIRIWA